MRNFVKNKIENALPATSDSAKYKLQSISPWWHSKHQRPSICLILMISGIRWYRCDYNLYLATEHLRTHRAWTYSNKSKITRHMTNTSLWFDHTLIDFVNAISVSNDAHTFESNRYLHGALKGSEEGLSAPGFPVAVPFSVLLLVVVCSVSTNHRRYSLASERRLTAGFMWRDIFASYPPAQVRPTLYLTPK